MASIYGCDRKPEHYSGFSQTKWGWCWDSVLRSAVMLWINERYTVPFHTRSTRPINQEVTGTKTKNKGFPSSICRSNNQQSSPLMCYHISKWPAGLLLAGWLQATFPLWRAMIYPPLGRESYLGLSFLLKMILSHVIPGLNHALYIIMTIHTTLFLSNHSNSNIIIHIFIEKN